MRVALDFLETHEGVLYKTLGNTAVYQQYAYYASRSRSNIFYDIINYLNSLVVLWYKKNIPLVNIVYANSFPCTSRNTKNEINGMT
jgi:hypothetical protein